jgi:hypothetical protein
VEKKASAGTVPENACPASAGVSNCPIIIVKKICKINENAVGAKIKMLLNHETLCYNVS